MKKLIAVFTVLFMLLFAVPVGAGGEENGGIYPANYYLEVASHKIELAITYAKYNNLDAALTAIDEYDKNLMKAIGLYQANPVDIESYKLGFYPFDPLDKNSFYLWHHLKMAQFFESAILAKGGTAGSKYLLLMHEKYEHYLSLARRYIPDEDRKMVEELDKKIVMSVKSKDLLKINSEKGN